MYRPHRQMKYFAILLSIIIIQLFKKISCQFGDDFSIERPTLLSQQRGICGTSSDCVSYCQDLNEKFRVFICQQKRCRCSQKIYFF